MIPFITYGHSDYIEILRIHVNGFGNSLWKHILFINSSIDPDDEVLTRFDQVIYYDDSKPYASRMLECLQQVKEDYFLLILDTDIMLSVHTKTIDNFFDCMRLHDFDRIDLKQTFNFASSMIIDTSCWKTVLSKDIGDSLYLVKAEDPNDYIYNLNPSIWKKDSFVDMLTQFPNHNYRQIEGGDVQQYCKKFKVFKLHAKKFLECGWFRCVHEFKFLHISHGGRLLPLNDEFVTPSGQSYVDCYQEYLNIYSMYKLKDIKLKHFLG